MLGLRCCMGSLQLLWTRLLFLCAGASSLRGFACCRAWALGALRFSNCRARSQLLCSVWNLLGRGLKSMFLLWQVDSQPLEPPRKTLNWSFCEKLHNWKFLITPYVPLFEFLKPMPLVILYELYKATCKETLAASSIVYESKKLETNQMSINRELDK